MSKAKLINVTEVYSLVGTVLRGACAGRINNEAAKHISSLAKVVIRNATAEISYAKLQKGKVKIAYFEPQEASKD